MQLFIGIVVFICVCTGAAIWAYFKTKARVWPTKPILWVVYFVAFVAIEYVSMAITLGFLWCLAWIGIWMREILLWLIAAVLSPWHWFL